MSARITIRELARQLDLGEKTVSRGLHGHPDVSPGMARYVRRAAFEAGLDLPPLVQLVDRKPTRPPHVADAASIRAEGKHLGRFTYNGADWLPGPDGTHDGYEYRLGFYCIEREGADDGPAE